MIGNISNNNVSFRGRIVHNKVLDETFKFINKSSIEGKRDVSMAETFVDALDYILDETPDTDVFELREGATKIDCASSVTLLRNNVPLKVKCAYGAGYKDNLAWNAYRALYDFCFDNKALKTTNAIENYKNLDKEKEEINKSYDDKMNALKKSYNEAGTRVWQERKSQLETLELRRQQLYDLRVREASNRLTSLENSCK